MCLQVIFASLVLVLLVKPVTGDGYFQCKEQERQALLEIKQEFEDEDGILSTWTSGTDCCRNWRGVRCSNRTGHVTMLDLHVLRGNISLSLLKLRHLKYLDLSENDFGGSPILDFKSAFENLRYVNFSWSNFGGSLSYQFANLSRLQSLDISFNNLKYRPESIRWLSSLSSIRVLDLSGVDLGRVKDLFQVVNTLPHLKELRLGSCHLSDDLLKNLNSSGLSLEVVDLSVNGFKGGVPKSFGRRLCSLKQLDVSNNELDGDLEILVGNISGCMEKSLEILTLYSNKLHGSLPDISIFTNLREVNLSSNQLNGSLPAKFMQPSKLEHLNLRDNQLIGSLPDVVMLPFLKELDVRDNRLDGTVSQSIGSLSELEILDVSGNSLTGTLSELHFLNLSKLRILDLFGNSLFLKLSQNWTPPFHLHTIGLGTCKQESGFFPRWIQTQKNCSVLNIFDAGIFDTVPSWLWGFSSALRDMDLSSNQLYGELPRLSPKISEDFSTLNLSFNNLEGELPLFPPSLLFLDLSSNKFSGNISMLCRMEAFYLDLSNNLLTDKIPDCFGQTRRLISLLNLANNSLSGEIPFSIGYLRSLQFLDLRNNRFHGNLPSSLGNCESLEFMDLSDNNLSGTLPAWIGQNLSSLVFLSLKSNHFSGVFPQDFCKLMDIQILDLAINNISGIIPQCIYNLTAMVKADNSGTRSIRVGPVGTSISESISNPYYDHIYTAMVRWKGREDSYGTNLWLLRNMDLSSNRLTGEIPSEITSLVNLTGLNLSRNGLFGKIPGRIGDLKEIESLDLSNNHLSGEIPSSLSDLSFLSHLDLSNNNLSGRIPTSTQIEGLHGSAFSGNHGLCGKPLETECPRKYKSEEKRNPEKEDSDENDDDEFWTAFYVGIGLGFVIGFWGICIVPLLKRQWRVSYLGFLDYLILKFHILLARFKNSIS